MTITQTILDAWVIDLTNAEIDMAKTTANLRRRDDPAAFYREDEIMMLQNLIYVLRDYDISSDFLEQSELKNCYEMAIQITTDWSRYRNLYL